MSRQPSEQVIEGVGAISVNDPGTPTPPGWERVALTSIARLESGHTPSRQHPEWWGGDVPWISIPDARRNHGRWISETAENTNELGLANSAARLLPKGTVCLSRTASVGYCTVMARPMATSQDFVNWVCGPGIEPDFLMRAYLAEGKQLLKFGKGSTHTTIYFPEVLAFNITLPPLNEQKRIVAKIDALTEKSREAKEALEEVPALLEKLRQSILAAAFRGDLTKEWRAKNPNVEPASVLLERIRAERRKKWEESELAKLVAKGKPPKDDSWKSKYVEPEPVDTEGLPELPEGWCWASVDELCEVQLGQRRAPEYASERKYPYIRSANITWDGLDLGDLKEMGFANPDGLFLAPGDVLLNEASGSPSEVGKPVLWKGEVANCCYQATVLRLRVWSFGSAPTWIYWACLKDAVLGRFAELAPGVGMVHLTSNRMKGWALPLAPSKEQADIASQLERMASLLSASDRDRGALRAELQSLDSSILAKAFRGELVPQDPNDEPASVLLERIKNERASAEKGAGAKTTKGKRGK